ncbi:peptide ABC transporter ATPase [Endozoicomonas montiporae]|uniref:Peptide ABC transporter ATPase n=2 Tax=Endozoicomonas montiporae TaxID=1027273 RepID=A0A081N7H6_9GAMM|nr:ABC transporter ATP-binding protein [Endozoicomonas montiporae]AMO55760.1 dipeptide ABC transporter ATP-binding protein [Endozoicomonas montiporae CL-33]KEQ14399.1 peptide ABC transporter ATPase [Endozoicomonas montiporae]
MSEQNKGQPLLSVENLSIVYEVGGEITRAVSHINLTLNRGETLGLIGETGAGKTTTALGVMRLVPNPPGRVAGGKVFYDGCDLLDLPEDRMREIRGNKVSMIFQDPMTSLNPVMTVGDQIAEVVLIHQSVDKPQSINKAKEMLEMVGIPAGRYSEYPHQFSGGMKQRVVIAIALACNPDLLIADEPTTALDVTIQAQVLDLMKGLKQKYNTAMIMISHDLGVVAQVCDKVAIMYAGEIVESGPIRDVYQNTQHPYTKGLFGSIPDLNKDVERLVPIKGLMPDPTHLPKGCRFHPRCPEATALCSKVSPKPVSTLVGGDHIVSCHLAHPQLECAG